MLRALLLVALIGCGDHQRANDKDCAAVRKLVDAMPRRYRDQPVDTKDRDALKQLTDPAIAKALQDPQLTYARLDGLCMRDMKPRDHDCTEVRRVLNTGMAIPPGSGETGIFDPSLLQQLAKLDFRDAEVGKAVRELADTAWTAYTPQGAPPAPLTRLASLCPGITTP